MTFTEAAAEVLRIAGKPLHYKEITELAIEKNLLSHVGKSPEVTMGARLAALLKKEDKENPHRPREAGRLRPPAEWDGKSDQQAAAGAPQQSKRPAPESSDEENADVEVNALELERGMNAGSERELDDEPIQVSGEDALRADLAASGAEMFDDEEDDDQPIFGGANDDARPASERAKSPPAPLERSPSRVPRRADGGRRRRRRRRRRGGRDNVDEAFVRAADRRRTRASRRGAKRRSNPADRDRRRRRGLVDRHLARSARAGAASDDPRPPADHGRRRADRDRHSAR